MRKGNASREYDAILAAETSADSADARRVLRNERMALQSAIQSGYSVEEQAYECARVRALWTGSPFPRLPDGFETDVDGNLRVAE